MQGDFNLCSIAWDDENLLGFYISPNDKKFLDCFTNFLLSQIVRESTNFPPCAILDLCLLSTPERVCSNSIQPLLTVSCSHGAVLVKYTFQHSFDKSEGMI